MRGPSGKQNTTIVALLFFSCFQKEEKKPDLTPQADLIKTGQVEDPLDVPVRISRYMS